MQSMKTLGVLFLGEQDGIAERELKIKLSECFVANGAVDIAYLARVSFTEFPAPQVALCLRGEKERAALSLECAGKAFSDLFKTTQHLDILFLSDIQATDIKRVVKPFYAA